MSQKRLAIAFACGVLGTVVMSLPMIAATAAGVAPMPKPIPVAIVGSVLGPGLPKPLLMILAAGSHLVYGGVWAVVLTAVTKRPTIRSGLGLGAVLWLLMQVAVLPALGWGLFGSAVTPKIAVGTLILHLIYGATTGSLLQRFLTESHHRAERKKPEAR